MLQNDQKLYIVTRSDLSAGLQAAQSCHALSKFYEEHRIIASKWYNESNYICLLACKDVDHLTLVKVILENNNLNISVFYEPDLNNVITAIAVEPSDISRRLLANLPLALRDNKSNNIVSNKEKELVGLQHSGSAVLPVIGERDGGSIPSRPATKGEQFKRSS